MKRRYPRPKIKIIMPAFVAEGIAKSRKGRRIVVDAGQEDISPKDISRKYGFDRVGGSETHAIINLRTGKPVAYLRRNVNANSLRLMSFLLSKGLPVEEPFFHGSIGERKYAVKPLGNLNAMGYAVAGKSLASLESSLTQKQRIAVLDKLADILSRIHALRVSHNHIHAGNIVLRRRGSGYAVRIIDWKKGDLQRLDWHNPKDIFSYFHQDYFDLLHSAAILLPGQAHVRKLFELLVSRYPINSTVREELLHKIDKSFLNYSVRDGKVYFIKE